MENGKGVPIGSYLSQYFANFYLAYFDHWLKEEMKCKYVVRYMDDIVIMSSSKERLHELRKEIEIYLEKELKLKLKENYQVFPTAIRGIDFVGYRHLPEYILLRKKTCNKFKRRMRRLLKYFIDYSGFCSFYSYKGWLMWCNSFRLQEKYNKPLQEKIDNYYNKYIKIC